MFCWQGLVHVHAVVSRLSFPSPTEPGDEAVDDDGCCESLLKLGGTICKISPSNLSQHSIHHSEGSNSQLIPKHLGGDLTEQVYQHNIIITQYQLVNSISPISLQTTMSQRNLYNYCPICATYSTGELMSSVTLRKSKPSGSDN